MEIIKRDDIFDWVEAISKTMILRRTSAPFFDPLADSWRDQQLHRGFLKKTQQLKRVEQMIPSAVFNLIPDSLRLKIQKYL